MFVFEQTDKASMLDEAIEYLKQLQLQVQVTSFILFFEISFFKFNSLSIFHTFDVVTL